MDRRWLVQRTNPEYVAYLAERASVSSALAQVLINRGVKSPEEAAAFIGQTRGGGDPFSIPGLREAVALIDDCLARGLKVFVHGDYDVDGLTSTAIMVEALAALGADVSYCIPNRFTDGYGFNPPGVERARQVGAGLVITVDCGITSDEAVLAARDLGMKVLVTDHHEPFVDPLTGVPRLPGADVIVNPKLIPLEADPDGARFLSGAGVALRLVRALDAVYPGRIAVDAAIDLAALGTLADSVPLVGENRALVRAGLVDIFGGRRAGIRALAEVSGLNRGRTHALSIPFTLIPRLNAPGRLDDSTEVVGLLLSRIDSEAEELAQTLHRKNAERQRIEERVLQAAIEQVEDAGGPLDGAIVLAGEGWHEGVIGIVASRIVDRYSRPTVVISTKGDMGRGSGRSMEGFDLHAGLASCADLLTTFGGHRQAVGLRLRTEMIPAFRERLAAAVAAQAPDFSPTLRIDAAVELREITPRLLEEISSLEPFGFGNPEPLFGARGLDTLGPRIVGKNHLKLRLRAGGCAVEAIGYGMGESLALLEEAEKVDAAFSVTLNEWNGSRILQLKLKALRDSSGANAPERSPRGR